MKDWTWGNLKHGQLLWLFLFRGLVLVLLSQCLRYLLHILNQGVSEPLLVEGGGGVVHGEYFLAIHVAGPAVHSSDSLPGEEAGHGVPAEGYDQFRAQEVYLLFQPGIAGPHLFGEGVPVPGGSALDYVGYVDLFSCQVNGCEQFFQELAGRADEGSALLIFVVTGAFTYEHDPGTFRAFTRDDVGATLAKTTGCALLNLLVQKVKLHG